MTTLIEGIVFDFDGTILDSETSIVEAYTEIYARYDQVFPVDQWLLNVGTIDHFEPWHHLRSLSDAAPTAKEIYEEAERLNLKILDQRGPMPGVKERIAEVKALNLKLGCASSSPTRWLNHHLPRLGLMFDFEVVRGRTDVGDRQKPDPAVYLSACEGLRIDPTKAIAFEDTSSGVAAAKAAGMFAVAIPNAITRVMDLSAADLIIDSLAETTIESLIAQLTNP